MKRDLLKPWKRTAVFLMILLAVLLTAACGKAETASPVSAESVVDKTEAGPKPAAASAEEIHPFENTSPQGEQEDTLTENPAETGDPFTLSETQQYAANLSLSNFSEQWFCEIGTFDHYDSADTSIAQLFSFAHLWAKINRPTELEYRDSYETMTRETFFEIIGPRIAYPEDLQPIEGEDYSAALGIGTFDWNHCWYENGRFYYPAGDGESYNRFTVVDEAYRINDGTCRFRFTIYELDLDIYFDELGIPSRYYHLTPAEAAQLAANGTITAVHTGTAVCSPIYWQSSGREMYQLAYYALDHTD